MNEEHSSQGRVPRAIRVPSGGLWALWFVVASLVGLVVMHFYQGQRATELENRNSTVLEEAGRLGPQISLLKARQIARLEGFLLSGDPSFRRQYVGAIADEDTLFSRLYDLAVDLDLEVRERLAELRDETTAWDLANQDIFSRDSIGEALAVSQRGYVDLERRARQLDEAIQREVSAGRRAMAEVRAWQTRLTFAFAILAMGATVVVGRVGWRFRDLSEQAETRRKDAVDARREIDAVLEATGDGVLGIDLGGKCTSLNRAGTKLLGYTERQIKGRDIHDTLYHSLKDGSLRPRKASPVLDALAAGSPVDSPDGAILWRRRRRSFPARWSLRPLIDGTDLRGAVLTFTDMTEVHEKEEALKRAIQQREDVVSIVSHDLRNPLGVVLAASDLLVELPLDEDERRRQAKIISRSGKRMHSLIEDLLDVSRIEAGAFVTRPSLEEVFPILEEARKFFSDQAEGAGVGLTVIHSNAELKARIDRDRILQALSNLLDNALRHTPQGGSVVITAVEGDGFVDLTVTDDGPGIEPTVLEHLFDRFSQSTTGGGGGAGLGLAIVKGVAEGHDGEVSVTSQFGEGATFTIRLPRD